MREMRFHCAPCARRNRIVAGASSETPAMIPNCDLSLCHPMPAPGRYSLTPTCRKAPASQPANSATRTRRSLRNAGISLAGSTERRLKSYLRPKLATLRLPKCPWNSKGLRFSCPSEATSAAFLFFGHCLLPIAEAARLWLSRSLFHLGKECVLSVHRNHSDN